MITAVKEIGRSWVQQVNGDSFGKGLMSAIFQLCILLMQIAIMHFTIMHKSLSLIFPNKMVDLSSRPIGSGLDLFCKLFLNFKRCLTKGEIKGGSLEDIRTEISGKHSLNMVQRVLDSPSHFNSQSATEKNLLPILTFKQISHMNFPTFSDISKLYAAAFSLSR